MNTDSVTTLGIRQLANITSKKGAITKWKTWLADYQLQNAYKDDIYIWLCCILALRAVDGGNFGIGCILVDDSGNPFIQGHNEMFSSYFRSDRHAEMVVMDKFEEHYRKNVMTQNYTLYTSVEPCPMCLARLILSGIPTVLYAAPDKFGGMVQKIKNFPQLFLDLSQKQIF